MESTTYSQDARDAAARKAMAELDRQVAVVPEEDSSWTVTESDNSQPMPDDVEALQRSSHHFPAKKPIVYQRKSHLPTPSQA